VLHLKSYESKLKGRSGALISNTFKKPAETKESSSILYSYITQSVLAPLGALPS
jgi:hypothetical protein